MSVLPQTKEKSSILLRGADIAYRLGDLDKKGIRVFTTSDFRKILHGYHEKSIARILQDAQNLNILSCPSRGIFVNEKTERPRTHLLYEVARTMRRGSYTYLSLESALSEYGVISQVPVNNHTFMTTGRKGVFHTPYGVIEFTHTSRDPISLVRDLIHNDRPLPIATMERALSDLRRTKKNTHLIQEDEVERIVRQQEEEAEDAPVF